MTLDFYILRRFLFTLGSVFGVVVALVLTIDTIDVLGSIRSENIGFTDAVWLSSLRVPDILITVLPLIVLISSLMFCMGLSRSSEFVITRAVGRPMVTTLLGPLIVSMVIASFVVTTLGPMAGRLAAQFDSARAQFSNTLETRLQVTASGLWSRDADDDTVTVLNAATSVADGTQLNDVTVFRFSVQGELLERFEARTGFISENEIILTQVKIWDFSRIVDNPELSAQTRGVLRLPTSLTAQQIRDGQPEPKTLFLWDLPKAIKGLKDSGSSTLSHKAHFLSQTAAPVYFAAMFLIGACFSLQTSRFGGRGLAVVGAITLGFFLFFFHRTSLTFGEAGELPLGVATWSPALAAFLGSFAWLLRKEDG